jgi:formylmethanofuran dehydrogenase subunit A
MWTIGLELILLIDDPWKIYLTTDHPNGAPFTSYPRIVSWLMSDDARKKTLKRINKKARRKALLSNIDREYDFYEVTIATRAGQAKALGLKDKGHLGKGADADVAIYDINPEQIDPSKDYKTVRKAFKNTAYTIKDGEILVKDGNIVKSIKGKTIWVDVKLLSPMEASSEIKRRFRNYWTVEYENYIIPENFLSDSVSVSTEAEV